MKIDVKKVAKLANLTITPEEEVKFKKQLSDILQYVEQLNNLDTTDIIPTSQVTGLENVTFPDETSASLTAAEALSGTENKHNDMFKVKAVLSSE